MTLSYAKYIDENTIKLPPRKLVTPHLVAFNFNENEALMRQEGYLPLVETNKPEDGEDEEHIARATYEQKEDCIEVTYVAEDKPEETEE